MRVLQLLSSMGTGEATDYDALSLSRVLRDMGFQTAIYAEEWDRQMSDGAVLPMHKLPRPAADDVIIYHKAADSCLSVPLEQFSCRKLMIFHGVTPPRYFQKYSQQRTVRAKQSMQELCRLADKVDYCMADTSSQESLLRELNYRCPIVIRPLMIPFSEYAKPLAVEDASGYAGSDVLLLSAGKLLPNRRYEDVIRTFYCYQRYCNPDARLLIVGNCDGLEPYEQRLKRYAAALELEERIVFAPKQPLSKMLACYRAADLFLSMSEQEDFSLPLVEAMYFGVPIAARSAGAVPDTLAGCGLLLPTKDPLEAALAVHRVLQEPGLKREVIAGQRKRQQQLAFSEIRRLFEQQFRDFLDFVPVNGKKKLLHFAAGSKP